MLRLDLSYLDLDNHVKYEVNGSLTLKSIPTSLETVKQFGNVYEAEIPVLR